MKRARMAAVIAGLALLFPFPSSGRQTQTPEDLTREKIFAAGPEWQQKYDGFQPGPDMLDLIKSKMEAKDTIEIYLGLWCPDSRNHVPTFLKMMDKLGTDVPMRYFGLGRKASRDDKYYYEPKQVEKVPTFIFYRDGKEIGRIIERPKAGIVEDTLEILFK